MDANSITGNDRLLPLAVALREDLETAAFLDNFRRQVASPTFDAFEAAFSSHFGDRTSDHDARLLLQARRQGIQAYAGVLQWESVPAYLAGFLNIVQASPQLTTSLYDRRRVGEAMLRGLAEPYQSLVRGTDMMTLVTAGDYQELAAAVQQQAHAALAIGVRQPTTEDAARLLHQLRQQAMPAALSMLAVQHPGFITPTPDPATLHAPAHHVRTSNSSGNPSSTGGGYTDTYMPAQRAPPPQPGAEYALAYNPASQTSEFQALSSAVARTERAVAHLVGGGPGSNKRARDPTPYGPDGIPKCHICGSPQHLARACPQKRRRDTFPPCPHCGLRSHAANTCYSLPQNFQGRAEFTRRLQQRLADLLRAQAQARPLGNNEGGGRLREEPRAPTPPRPRDPRNNRRRDEDDSALPPP
jgi:hypothetical protein